MLEPIGLKLASGKGVVELAVPWLFAVPKKRVLVKDVSELGRVTLTLA